MPCRVSEKLVAGYNRCQAQYYISSISRTVKWLCNYGGNKSP